MKFRVKDASSTHFMLRAGSTKNLLQDYGLAWRAVSDLTTKCSQN